MVCSLDGPQSLLVRPGADAVSATGRKGRSICARELRPRVLHLELAAHAAPLEMSADAINYIKKPTEDFLRDDDGDDHEDAGGGKPQRWSSSSRRGCGTGCPRTAATARVSVAFNAAVFVDGRELPEGGLAQPQPALVEALEQAAARLAAKPPLLRRLWPTRLLSARLAPSPSPLSVRSPPPPPPTRRVLKDRAGDVGRVLHYGLRWLLREAHLHPDQQHHRRDGLDGRSGRKTCGLLRGRL